VDSEWAAGVFGIAGVAVGAGATLAANWITARTQVKLAVSDREQQIAESRRVACADYLVTVDSFLDQARDLVADLENSAPESQLDTAEASYRAGWEHLQRKCAPVVVAGPPGLGELAEGLKSKLGALADECDGWYAAHKSGSKRSRDAKVVDLQTAARSAKSAFVSAAQKL
jgi:hypothetical protein